MYHIELTKRIPSSVIAKIISIDSPGEFEEKISNISERNSEI